MADEPAHTPAEELACIEEVELVTDYLEGALPPAEARRLERHLEICPGCIEYVRQMRTLAAGLGGLAEGSIAAGRRDDLIAAFRRAGKS